ncbi:MAG: hypothetical protein ABL962_20695, partial [Fimbriimonadaceae bacterium]
MTRKSYNRSVFINCPIDDEYTPLFRATVFTVLRCDHHARCAIEEDDSSEVRLTKIFRMITECRLGIHDLSRTQLGKQSRLPRFNMPLELGIFLGAKHFGRDEHDKKTCLIFESTPYSYEKFISDIKGQDISSHGNSPRTVVKKIRNWLASNSARRQFRGGDALWKDYVAFNRWLPGRCRREGLKEADLIFGDLINCIYA